MASIKLAGDTSGEVTISAPAVAGTTTLTLPATSSTLATQNALGVRNLIINGDMRIDQRNAGASVTYNGIEAVYNIDRFQAGAIGGGSFTVEQSTTAPSGFDYSQKYTVGTADTSLAATDRYSMYHYIEGNNVAHLDFGLATAKTVTVSFWVRSSTTGTFGVYLSNAAYNRSIPSTFTINSANTWEQKTITFTGDTTGTWLKNNLTGLVLGVSFAMGSTYQGTANTWAATAYFTTSSQTNWMATSGATFYITGVQLEVGDTATPFEHRPYDMELARCQRYYETIGKGGAGGLIVSGNTSSAQQINTTFTYKVTKRATPVVTKVGTWTLINAPSQPVVYGPDVDNVLLYMLNVNGYGYAQNTANTMYITIEAEL